MLLLSSADFFLKIKFFKKFFQEHYQSVKRCDLVPNCLQRISADNKSLLSERVKMQKKAENHGRNIIGIYQKISFF